MPDPATSTAAWHCSACNFAVTDSAKHHQRLVHQQSAQATYPGEPPQRCNRLNAVFTCKRCHFSSPDPSRFQEHARECHAPDPSFVPAEAISVDAAPFPRQTELTPPTSPISSPAPGLASPRLSFPRDPPTQIPLADFPQYTPSDFVRLPESSTITSHPSIPLRSYGLVINVELGGVIICVTCGSCVAVKQTPEHIRLHFRGLDLPANLSPLLQDEFDLIPWQTVPFPPPMRRPIFGLTISPDAHLFCSRCGHGYANEASLRTHQSSPQCPRIGDELDAHYIAYAQSLGFTSAKFSVDVDALPRRAQADFDPSRLYATTFAPPPDYSLLPVSLPVNTQDLDQFFHREQWIPHLAQMTPEQTQLIARLPDEADESDIYVENLREYLIQYLQLVQSLMAKHASHGLMRKMARVGKETDDEFRILQPKTLKEYSRELFRLLFNAIEQARGAVASTYYPLTDNHKTTLLALYNVLSKQTCRPEMAAPTLHLSLFLLFTQEKEHGAVPNFDLVVISFLVARSMGPSEWIRTTEIGRVVAKLMWATRAIVFYEMERIMKIEKLGSSAAYERFKVYLIDGEETPMAYLYNVAALLVSIRGEEYTEASSQITDANGRELSFGSELVKLDDVKRLHDGLADEYANLLKTEIFFGESIPDWFDIEIDIRTLVDDPRNNTAGYCLLDHPQNGFLDQFSLYGQWLLSCPIRAARLVDIIDGRISWKAGPAYQLLISFTKLRRLLCTRKIVDVGPSVRASEIARDLLRNISGAAIRSLLLLYHLLCVVGVQDKTSHRILKKRFTPGAPTHSTSVALLKNLVFFRRFESDLVRFFKGDAHAERYNMYLWPNIAANMTADVISEDLGDATERYLGARLQILEWRHVSTAFMHFHGGFDAEGAQDRHYDLLANHSSATARQRYGVDRQTLANAPTRHIIGCLSATIKWQELARVAGATPLRLTNSASPLSDVLLPDIAVDGPDAPQPAHGSLSRSDIISIVEETLRVQNEQNSAKMKDALATTVASLAAIYFPPPPPPPLPHALPPLSSVLVDPSRLTALRAFLRDPTAQFRCPQQGELIERMQARERHLLAIIACDFGKTTMIMLQAKQFDAHLVTLVILPLSGLHRDFHIRAVAHGLKISVFDPRHDNSAAGVHIMYASIEHAISETYLQYAVALQNQGRLARIVVDEVHLLLTAASYREPMQKLFKILGVKTHITAMSATIPPQLFPAFCELTGTDSWQVLRMPTARQNIAYRVVLCKEDYKAAAVGYLVKRVKNDYAPGDKAMIFCRTRSICDDVAQLLHTTAYHSKQSEELRAKTFEAWVKGEQRIIVSTSMLGAGVDQPVRDVVHVDVGWNIIDQFQEDNRAGRNKRRARCTYFLPDKRHPIPPEVGKPFGAELLVPWAFNKQDCRRVALSLFLDGVAVTCIELSGELCDNCQRKVRDAKRVPPRTPTVTPIATTGAVDGTRAPSLLIVGPPVPEASTRAPVQFPHIAGPGSTTAPVTASSRSLARPTLAPILSPRVPTDEEQDVFGIVPLAATHRLPEPTPPHTASPAQRNWDPYNSPSPGSVRHPHPPSAPSPPTHARRRRDTPTSASHSSRYTHTQSAPPPHYPLPTPRAPAPAPYNSPAPSSRQVDILLPPTRSHHSHTLCSTGPPPNYASSSAYTLHPALPPPNAHAPRLHQANTAAAPPVGLSIQIATELAARPNAEGQAFYDSLLTVLDAVKGRCAACWARGIAHWETHSLATCERRVATPDDTFWVSWHEGALRSTRGFCWRCCRPQMNGTHPWDKAVGECAHHSIVKAAIYAVLVHPADHVCPAFFPLPPQTPSFQDIWEWSLQPEPAPNPKKITRLLRMFMSLAAERSRV